MTRRRVGCRCDSEPHPRNGESRRRRRRPLSCAGGRGSHGRRKCKNDPVFQNRYECRRAQVAIVTVNYGWNLDGEKAAPEPGRHLVGVPVAEFRQLDTNLKPYASLKAARAANPTAVSITLSRGGITWQARRRSCRSRRWARNVQRPQPAGVGSNLGQPGLRRHAV
jgi:hypothetical protein